MNTITRVFASLGLGLLAQISQDAIMSHYFNTFLEANLVNLLVALLAVNSATMGIVLTKIRDLLDKRNLEDGFAKTKQQMLLAIKEQLALIVLSIIFLTLITSPYVTLYPNLILLLKCGIAGVFVYSMHILYDTAKSVLIIIDYK
ncbi:MAG: hypothetical protein WC696_06135 [Candidatus Methylopumilus sp.]|jgi:hypothetical protein